VNNWNYCNNIEHITNNASEKIFNNYLNNLFPKNPTFFKLIIALKKKDEALSYIFFKKKKKKKKNKNH